MVSLHDQWNPDFVDSSDEKKMVQNNNNRYYIKILHCCAGEGKFALVLIIHKVKKNHWFETWDSSCSIYDI